MRLRVRVPRIATSTSASTEASDATAASLPPPLPGGLTMTSPKSGLRPFAPRNNSPLCKMPSPRLCSTLTTRKSLSSRAWPNQCSAKVTKLTSLSIETATPRRLVRSAAKLTSRSLKIGLCRQMPAARSTTPGSPTQMPAISAIESSASLTQRRTPSSTRSAITGADCRSIRIGKIEVLQHVGAEIGRGDGDLIGRQLHADDVGRVGIEFQHHARAAASRVAHRAHGNGNDQSIVEQRRGDRRDRRRAQFGEIGYFHPRNRPEPADRVHHMEAIDGAHQFRVGGLHRIMPVRFPGIFIREAELIPSSPALSTARAPQMRAMA